MRVHRTDPIKNARQKMVFTQLKANGVTDKMLLNAFEKTPREYFIPITSLSLAYSDSPIYCDITGRYLFPPHILGIFLQHLSLKRNDKVLVVGGNYGYTATILFEIGCIAYIVEPHPILIAKCREKLKKQNIAIESGPLMAGMKENSPYKAIIIELGLISVPDSVVKQLEEGGKIAACIVDNDQGSTKACVFEKTGGMLHKIFSIETNMPMCPEFSETQAFIF